MSSADNLASLTDLTDDEFSPRAHLTESMVIQQCAQGAVAFDIAANQVRQMREAELKPWAWHLGVSFAFGGFIVGYPLLNAMGFFLPPSVAQTAPICCNAKGLHSWVTLC